MKKYCITNHQMKPFAESKASKWMDEARFTRYQLSHELNDLKQKHELLNFKRIELNQSCTPFYGCLIGWLKSQEALDREEKANTEFNEVDEQINDLTQKINDRTEKIDRLKVDTFHMDDKENLKPFKNFFDKFLQEHNLEYLRESIDQKPLCIYAVMTHDDQRTILSTNGLKNIQREIKQLQKYNYTVIPILFENKNELDKQSNEIKSRLGINCIWLLWLNGHGSKSHFTDFDITQNNKLESISSNTQIILATCEAANGVLKKSLAYKLSKDNNGCEVFAPKDSITLMFPTIVNNQDGKPQVKEVIAYGETKNIQTCSIKINLNAHYIANEMRIDEISTQLITEKKLSYQERIQNTPNITTMKL